MLCNDSGWEPAIHPTHLLITNKPNAVLLYHLRTNSYQIFRPIQQKSFAVRGKNRPLGNFNFLHSFLRMQVKKCKDNFVTSCFSDISEKLGQVSPTDFFGCPRLPRLYSVLFELFGRVFGRLAISTNYEMRSVDQIPVVTSDSTLPHNIPHA